MPPIEPTAKAGASTSTQDASAKSSTAPTTSGPASAKAMLASLSSEDAKATKAPTGVDAAKTQDAAPPGAPAEKSKEGETAGAQAGKPDEGQGGEKEPDKLPPWVEKRVRREQNKAAKAAAAEAQVRNTLAAKEQLLEVALAENERLHAERAEGKPYDAKAEEIRQLQIEKDLREAKDKHAREQTEGEKKRRTDERRADLAKRIETDITEAVAEFPETTSFIEVLSAMKKSPDATAKEVAKQLHERRRAAILKSHNAATDAAPTTVDKTTGRGGFSHPASARGMKAWMSVADQKP